MSPKGIMLLFHKVGGRGFVSATPVYHSELLQTLRTVLPGLGSVARSFDQSSISFNGDSLAWYKIIAFYTHTKVREGSLEIEICRDPK